MSLVRLCSVEDLTWLVDLAQEAYVGLEEGMDRAATARWFLACLSDPAACVVRAQDAAAFAQKVELPWAPGRFVCDLLHLFGRRSANAGLSMEPIRLVRFIDAWRKSEGCRKLYIGSIYADIAPIAQRLGGRPLNVGYVIE